MQMPDVGSWPGEGPIIDRAVLERYRGREELLARLARSFTDQTERELRAIARLVSHGQATEAGDIAHGMAGAASLVGAVRLSSGARAFSQAGSEGDLAAVERLWPGLESLARETLAALSPLL